MIGMFGRKATGDDEPFAGWPYFAKAVDAAEQLANMKAVDADLVWDGTRYVWKK